MSGPGKDSYVPEGSPVDVNQFGFGGVVHDDMTGAIAFKLPTQVTVEPPTRASQNHDVAMQSQKSLRTTFLSELKPGEEFLLFWYQPNDVFVRLDDDYTATRVKKPFGGGGGTYWLLYKNNGRILHQSSDQLVYVYEQEHESNECVRQTT